MLGCEICLQMSYKTLGQLAVEASKNLEFAIAAVQCHLLPNHYLSLNSIDQALDDNHNWNKMVFVELKHEEYCCKQTPLAASMSSSCLADC